MATCCCGGASITKDDPRFVELDAFIATCLEQPGSLISVLHKAQELFGFLPEEVQEHIAVNLGIPKTDVYGVVTFYNFFNTDPVGQYTISVCMGTACYVRGAGRLLTQLETELNIKAGNVTEDGLFSLEVCRCVGACSLAPAVVVDGEVRGKLVEGDIKPLLDELRAQAGVPTRELVLR